MIICWGINHQTAPAAQRERIVVLDAQYPRWMHHFRTAGLQNVVLLSTCNRTEFYAVLPTGRGIEEFKELVQIFSSDVADVFGRYAYVHRDDAAVMHLLRVASSLDSMVVGEPQILGQVKTAYEQAQRAGGVGHQLHRLFQRALQCAKQVREQTGVGERPVSVGSVAVALAEQILGSIDTCTAFVIGAGDMGQQITQCLRSGNIQQLLITNRTEAKSTALAKQYDGAVVPWEQWTEGLRDADIVICSVGAEQPIVQRAHIEQAQKDRDNQPLILIDISMPRNIEAAANEVPGVYLYDIDDLRAVADANLEQRKGAVHEAEAMVATFAGKLWGRIYNGDTEVVASLHQKCEEIRRREVQRSLERLKASDPEVAKALDGCTQAIVSKILHDPILSVKTDETQTATESTTATLWLRRLFRLDPT